MDSLIEGLLNRVSFPRLTAPAPSADSLDRILRCALRAPDHALLRPWRFIVYQEGSLSQLSDAFVAAGQSDMNLDDTQMQKLRGMTSRAPMIIVGIASYKSHPKVPEKEQLLSAGSAFAYMLAAIQAEGFGAIWRTGPMATHSVVLSKLGVAENEEILGFLYVGTPLGEPKTIPHLQVSDYVEFK